MPDVAADVIRLYSGGDKDSDGAAKALRKDDEDGVKAGVFGR